MAKFKEEDVYIFNKERECMTREEFRELQLRCEILQRFI